MLPPCCCNTKQTNQQTNKPTNLLHHLPIYITSTYHLHTYLPIPFFSPQTVTMENAANAVTSLFTGSSNKTDKSSKDASATSTTGRDVDTTVDSKVAPAVEHTHVKKTHETRQQTNVEKEKHQDHYHTTVQPVADREVLPEKHEHKQEAKHRELNRDDGSAKAKAEADRAGFKSTRDERQFESKTVEPTTVEENVHHHLHETIQPVIEKGTCAAPSPGFLASREIVLMLVRRGRGPVRHPQENRRAREDPRAEQASRCDYQLDSLERGVREADRSGGEEVNALLALTATCIIRPLSGYVWSSDLDIFLTITPQIPAHELFSVILWLGLRNPGAVFAIFPIQPVRPMALFPSGGLA